MRLRSRVLLQIVLLVSAIIVAGLCWLTVATIKSSSRAESERAVVSMILGDLRLFHSSVAQSEVAGQRYLNRLFDVLPVRLDNVIERAQEAGWHELVQTAREAREILLHWRDSRAVTGNGEIEQYRRNQALLSVERTLDAANLISAKLAAQVYANQKFGALIYASSVAIFVVLIIMVVAMMNYMFVAPLGRVTNRVKANAPAAPAVTGKVVVHEVLELARTHDISRSALMDSEQRMRAIFEQPAVGIGLAGPGRVWLAMNEKFCQMIGYSEAELLALGPAKVSLAEDYEKQLEYHRRVLAGEIDSYILEKRFIRKDGSLIWANMAIAIIRNDHGGIRYEIGIMQDITARIEAEEAAEAHRGLLEATLNSTADAVIACDSRGDFTIFNRAAQRLHGLGAQQLPSDEWAAAHGLYHIDGKTPLGNEETPLSRALEGETVYNFEFVIAAKNLEPQIVRANAAPVLDAAGNQLGAVATVQNITDHKRAEQALRESHETLELRVKERTADLAAANARLQELDQLKSMFIASMSHELRTPLNSVIGFAGLMLMRTDGPLNEVQEDYMRRVKNSGKHLLDLISDVIDVSKIEAAIIEADIQPFDLADVFDEAIESMQPETRTRNLSIELAGQYHVDVVSDRKRVLQCLLNYLSNAVKFGSDGQILIEARELGDRIEIAVIDQGIGIDEPDQARLFRQFSRINTAQSRDLPGTGLGLYLTAQLTRQILGGDVGVESRAGAGSRFWFTMARELKT